jgi:transposase
MWKKVSRFGLSLVNQTVQHANPTFSPNLNSTLGNKACIITMIGLPHQIQPKEQEMRLVIGIDVSKKKLDVSIYDGSNHDCFSIKNDVRSIRDFIKEKKFIKDEVLFVMEATGVYHLRLAIILHESGYQVGVVNPLILKRFSQMKMVRAKTDKLDSKLIAEYGYGQDIKLFEPRSKARQRIIKILKAIDSLAMTKEAYRNRIEAIDQDPCQVKLLNRSYHGLIKKIQKMIGNLESEALEIVKENYLSSYERLLTIAGVGSKTALLIIGFFGDFEDFENSKQVASFIGINPSPRESGSSLKGRGRISKQGNKFLRKQLFMTSLSAMQFNRSCKELYERLKIKGKEHKVCRVAVMNKLIKQIFAIVKFDRTYDPNYTKNILSLQHSTY